MAGVNQFAYLAWNKVRRLAVEFARAPKKSRGYERIEHDWGAAELNLKRSVSMCDYSLHHVASRPAQVGDELTTSKFVNSITRGFASESEPNVAVCLLPGTELAFEQDVQCEPTFGFLPLRKIRERVARFRQVDVNQPHVHHDALEFPNGQIVLLTRLCEGQRATVLQLPASAGGPQRTHEHENHEHEAHSLPV
jgi:hypothetical protein